MSDKSAIVTGAGTGVGRAVALALAGAGYRVALAGRRPAPLEETIALATSAGARADDLIAIPTDVSDPDAVRALFDRTVESFGRLDLLFNNAGIGAPPVQIDELPLDAWHAVVNINLNGAFYCLQNAFRVMKAQSPQGGRIVNNGSISAHAPRPFSIAYTATKHAVTGLTKTASLDGRPFNIACGQIDIGNAETPMTARMKKGVPQADGSVKEEPLMAADEVGRAVVHMASLPLDTNVLFMTIMANNMPFVGRG